MAFNYDPNSAGNAQVSVDSAKKLRIGIIGTGGIANSHIKSYIKMPDVEIVAGCDLVPGRAKAFLKNMISKA